MDRYRNLFRNTSLWKPVFFLFILTVLTYLPSFKNGFIWDDPQYVVESPTLKSAEGLWRIWTDVTATPQYYPLVHTTFWFEAQLVGTEHALLFHIDNVLLHAMAAVLLGLALRTLKLPGHWLAAAIFAVHPVMVESVSWVTERKNVLSIVLYLAAFLAYFRTGFLDVTPKSKSQKPPALHRWYWLSLVLFLLALFSKTVTCSLPAAILLIIYWKRGRLRLGDVKPLVPMLVMGLILSSLTSHLEHTRVGASGPDFQWSLLDRCLIAGHAVCFYALKLIWPHPLIFMYPRWNLQVDRAMQLLFPALVFSVVIGLWFARHRIGRGPLVAVLFFIGTLTPALGFVNVYPMRYSFVADHFQYLASIGLIALGSVLLAQIPRRWPAFVVLLPLVWITWHQQAIYVDRKTLWENTIAQNPTCWMAHVNLAGVYREQKQFEAAIRESKLAMDMAPHEADTHYDYGRDLALHAQWEPAIAQLRLAIQCDPARSQPWSDLSELLWDHSSTPEAQAEAYQIAQHGLELNPDLGAAHYVLARVAEVRGDLAGAILEYNKALVANDQDFQSHYNLGNCLLQTGRPGEAAGEYQVVLKHDPKNAMAWSNLGYANLAVGKSAEAAEYFQKALSIKPDLVPARQGYQQAKSLQKGRAS